MRILMISDFYHPFIGGVEQHVRSLATALVERGHDVAVATLGQGDLPAVDVDRGVRVYRMRGSAQRVERLFFTPGRPWAPPLPDPELTWSLRDVITRERPDIVHGHDWLSRSFLPLKPWSRAKLVVSLHYYTLTCAKKNLLYEDAPCDGPAPVKCLHCAAAHYGSVKGLPTLAGAWMGSTIERRAVDMFVPVSQATAAGNGLVDSIWPYRVIPNFLPPVNCPSEDDLAPYVAQLPETDFLLFVGDLRRAKGLDILLQAYAGLESAAPLVLIGKVWPETPQSLPPNVMVLRDWPNMAVMEAWRRATLAVVPSIWPEPFGIVVIEAMSGGCPVVGSRIGGIPDIVVDGETGLLVPPADVDALRDTIARLLGDPDMMHRMGRAGLQRALAFHADAVVPQIEGVYEEVVARGDPARTALTRKLEHGSTLTPMMSPDSVGLRSRSPSLVSIIVNNYNYDRFLRDAIESALNQSYEHTEVIVVDDGSTDKSRDVIASYADRVIPVLKENGGQASAFNAGFAHSHGEIVIFLDSDDMLLPHIAATVAKVFESEPGIAKVQYRLDVVDAAGIPIGRQTPPAELPMPDGDLRHQILHFPDDVRTPPTSGNAFAASTLQQIFPIPEARYGDTGADLYLYNLSPLYGLVKSLSEAGGRYRVHGANHYYSSELRTEQIQFTIMRSVAGHEYIVYHANKLHLDNVPLRGSDILSVTFLVNRLASFKLDPRQHPIKGDTTIKLAWLGIIASMRRVDVPVRTRLLYMLWFVAAAGLPKPLTRWLVMSVFHFERRGLLSRFV